MLSKFDWLILVKQKLIFFKETEQRDPGPWRHSSHDDCPERVARERDPHRHVHFADRRKLHHAAKVRHPSAQGRDWQVWHAALQLAKAAPVVQPNHQSLATATAHLQGPAQKERRFVQYRVHYLLRWIQKGSLKKNFHFSKFFFLQKLNLITLDDRSWWKNRQKYTKLGVGFLVNHHF